MRKNYLIVCDRSGCSVSSRVVRLFVLLSVASFGPVVGFLVSSPKCWVVSVNNVFFKALSYISCSVFTVWYRERSSYYGSIVLTHWVWACDRMHHGCWTVGGSCWHVIFMWNNSVESVFRACKAGRTRRQTWLGMWFWLMWCVVVKCHSCGIHYSS